MNYGRRLATAVSETPQHMIFDERGVAVAPLTLAKFHLIEATPPDRPWCPATP